MPHRFILRSAQVDFDENRVRTWYVDDKSSYHAGSGTKGDPYYSIQDAIDVAVAGEIVKVAAGKYHGPIKMKDGVKVMGEGADVTVIDGSIDKWGHYVGKKPAIVAVDVGFETRLDGFTIANGNPGMDNKNSSLEVSNCVFKENQIGMYNDSSYPWVIDCTYDYNSAYNWDDGPRRGGGMYNCNGSSPDVTNCLFINNLSLEAGGAMYNDNAWPDVINCTFYDNSSGDSVGGDSMYNTNGSSPTVTNCIFWRSRPTNSYPIWTDPDSSASVSYSNIQNGLKWGGFSNMDLDPMFVAPGDGDFHLKPGSPCIDAGDNIAPILWQPTDFEGDKRIIDGDYDGTSTVDIGIDEYKPIPIIPVIPIGT
jgi:hypothetical protein